MPEQQPKKFLIPAEDYQLLLEDFDDNELRYGFLGRWASREAFGLSLLEDTNAAQHLANLPGWLRPYVQLDGSGYSQSHEEAGLFIVKAVTRGVCVIDAGLATRQQ